MITSDGNTMVFRYLMITIFILPLYLHIQGTLNNTMKYAQNYGRIMVSFLLVQAFEEVYSKE